MSVRIYLDGEDVTERVDVSAAQDMPSGPGHFSTEEELAWLLTGWVEVRGEPPTIAPGMQRTTITEGRRRWYRDDPLHPSTGSLS